MQNLKISQKGILLVLLTLVFQLSFVAALAFLLKNAEEQVEHERAVREVIFQINRLSGLIDNSSIGFAEQIQNEDSENSQRFHETYGKFLEQAPAQIGLLKSLTYSSPYRREVDDLSRNVLDGMSTMEACRKACIKNIPERFVLAAELKQTSRKITGQIDGLLKQYQRAQQIEMDNQAASRNIVVTTLSLGIILDIAIALFLVSAFTREIANRIKRVRDNALRLAAGEQLLPAMQDGDELGLLDRTFHHAAESLAEASRKEQAMLTNAVDLICSIDEKGIFQSVSPGSNNILGYDPAELIGRRCIDIVDQSDKARTRELFQEAAKTGLPMQFENLLRTKSDTGVSVGWSVHWLSAEQTLFCVVHDISQRKQVERLKQEFVAMVSHDLKAPLTSIQLILELTEMGAYGQLSDPGQARISDANADIHRLVGLVNGLLSLEKLESTDFELNLAEINANSVIDPSLHAVLALASRSHQEISVDNTADPKFYADKDRLTQVLVNLLSNAIKFSPDGGKIVISVEPQDKTIRFEIADDGKGIPEEMQKTIFERFRQLDKTDETVKGGIGLGLSICKTIVAKHGGTIGVKTSNSGGSAFWFEVPIAAP